MNASQLFLIANATAMVAWLMLGACIVMKRAAWRDRLGLWVPLVFCVAYAAVIGFATSSGNGEGGFDTLEHVQLLFRSPWGMLAGWIHYLAFDLFVGAWIARQVMEEGRPRWTLLMLLPLTLMFGPIGLLAHALTRRAFGKQPA
jgi:hypothetical protein